MKESKESKPFKSTHFSDLDGNPTGGTTFGQGFAIGWQNGPLGRGDDRQVPNGAFVEQIIEAAIDRLEYYQSSKFCCLENAQAISALQLALKHLTDRTERREIQGTEGTHDGN